MSEMEPGTEFGGYRIERLLGAGGFCNVYLAEDLRPALRRKVALKVLNPTLSADYKNRERFQRESLLAVELDVNAVIATGGGAGDEGTGRQREPPEVVISDPGPYRWTVRRAARAGGRAQCGPGTGWAVAVWIGRLRFRRHRGRWGLLQDRFSALVDGVATNPQRATRLADGHGAEAAPDVAALAADVAAVLDRVAFDPTWADDDAEYTRARTAIATLEHR